MGLRQRVSQALWWVRLRGRIEGNRYYISPSARIKLSRGARLRVGRDVHISRRSSIVVRAVCDLGADVFVGTNVTLIAYADVSVGAGARIAENVSIHTENHRGAGLERFSASPISIGAGSWIGAGAVLTQGAEVGEHVVIGANAVVTRNIPSRSVAAGVPARVLHMRQDL